MNYKKGFTLVELLSVIILLIIIVSMAILNMTSVFDEGRKKSFVDEAFVVSQGVMNKYNDDRLNNSYTSDLYANKNSNKKCYLIKSLIGPYVSKEDEQYKGSIEICTGDACTYKTKIWLTNGEYYLNGKIIDDSLSIDDIDGLESDEYFYSCGANITNITNEWLFDYRGFEETFIVPEDGTYALEAWGAAGGNAFTYVRGMFSASSSPRFIYGGKGGYSYGEVNLKKGQVIYVNVGGEGTFQTHDLKITVDGGYNGGGKANYSSGGGGGATHFALKMGPTSSLSDTDLLVVAGGGGAGFLNGCMEFEGSNGHNGGGFCENYKHICLGDSTVRKVTGLGAGGGYTTSTGAPVNNEMYYCSWGGVEWYGTNTNLSAACKGGTGYVNPAATKNGVMYVLDGYDNDSVNHRTYATTSYSEEPIAGYGKAGDGFAKITKLPSE